MKRLENNLNAEPTKRDAVEVRINESLKILESRLSAVEAGPQPQPQPPPLAAAAPSGKGGWIQNHMVLGNWPPQMSGEERVACAATWAKSVAVPHCAGPLRDCENPVRHEDRYAPGLVLRPEQDPARPESFPQSLLGGPRATTERGLPPTPVA